MNGDSKKFQWTGQWTRQDNGVAISENFTFRSDNYAEVLEKRLDVLETKVPSGKSFPDDEGPAAKQATQPSHPVCKVHGNTMSLRPAGTSKKTGKPYPAFWACTFKDVNGAYCRETVNN